MDHDGFRYHHPAQNDFSAFIDRLDFRFGYLWRVDAVKGVVRDDNGVFRCTAGIERSHGCRLYGGRTGEDFCSFNIQGFEAGSFDLQIIL